MFKWYYYDFLKFSIPYDFQKISIAAPSRYKAVHDSCDNFWTNVIKKSHSDALSACCNQSGQNSTLTPTCFFWTDFSRIKQIVAILTILFILHTTTLKKYDSNIIWLYVDQNFLSKESNRDWKLKIVYQDYF